MNPADIPLFGNLKARMDMLGHRQKLLAQNVANVSTPNYTPQDVDVNAFNRALTKTHATPGVAPVPEAKVSATRVAYYGGTSHAPLANAHYLQDAPDSETTLDGNSVVVEEQMMKMAETRMEFETMIGLYNKSLSLMRLSLKSPTG